MSPVTRDLVEFVSPGDVDPRLLVLPAPLGRCAEARPLSGRPAGGDGAVLVDLPPGTQLEPVAAAPHAFELIDLDGRLTADGVPLGRNGYVGVPAGTRSPLLEVAPGAEAARVFVDFVADVDVAQVLPASEEGWTESGGLVPGPPPGLARKPVRGQFGQACGFFLRVPAGWEERRTEWHDCAEACICLGGDLWHDRANGGAGGVMRRGSYFWRPRHVLHSPMGSASGCELWITVDGDLVNHYLHTDGPPPAGGQLPAEGSRP